MKIEVHTIQIGVIKKTKRINLIWELDRCLLIGPRIVTTKSMTNKVFLRILIRLKTISDSVHNHLLETHLRILMQLFLKEIVI